MSDASPTLAEETPKKETGPVWLRGGTALLLMIAAEIGQTLLWAIAILQFGWELISGEKNSFLRQFGASFAEWQRSVSRFVSGASEEKPFPWKAWPSDAELD